MMKVREILEEQKKSYIRASMICKKKMTGSLTIPKWAWRRLALLLHSMMKSLKEAALYLYF